MFGLGLSTHLLSQFFLQTYFPLRSCIFLLLYFQALEMKFFAATILSFSVLSASFALPSALKELSSRQVPEGTDKLAFDGTYVIAYDKDGEKIGVIDPSESANISKRAATCTPLTSDDAQKSKRAFFIYISIASDN
jgi:hypothetical protein